MEEPATPRLEILANIWRDVSRIREKQLVIVDTAGADNTILEERKENKRSRKHFLWKIWKLFSFNHQLFSVTTDGLLSE